MTTNALSHVTSGILRFVRTRSHGQHALLLLIALVLASGTVVGAWAQVGPAGPSPAQERASVVAHGVMALPEGDARWDMTQPTAAGDSDVQSLGAPGFAIALSQPLLVTDEELGQRWRIAAGEAGVVMPERDTRIETFGAPAPFTLVQLIGAAAPEPGADTEEDAVSEPWSSEPFASTGGEHDVNLIRVMLEPDYEQPLPAGLAPSLIFAERGEATVTTQDDETLSTADGPLTVEGPASITTDAEGTVVYAAFVGAELPQLSEATPEPEPEPTVPSFDLITPPATPESD